MSYLAESMWIPKSYTHSSISLRASGFRAFHQMLEAGLCSGGCISGGRELSH